MRNRILYLALVAALITGCGTKQNPNEITASGTIEATDVNVAAKVPAQIVTLYIDDGTPVDSGALIAVQDHSALDIQLREAQAAVEQARAQLKLTQVGARSEDIENAEQSVTQTEASRKLAADNLERIRNLAVGGAATKEQLEESETKFRVAQSQLDQAEATLAKMRAFSRPEDITAATARVDQLVAMRDAVQKQIDDCFISSPLKGTVTHKVAEQGELVAQGATVATVTDLSSVYLMIYVTEEQLPHVKLGDKADVTVDGMPNKTFMGTVTYISPEAEFTPKNIQTKDDRVKLVFGVKIEIPNPKGYLKKGLPADAVVHITK